jgi:hypothetical protein
MLPNNLFNLKWGMVLFFFEFDRWHLSGILVDKLDFRVVYDAGNILETKVASVMQRIGRNLRPTRSEALVRIQRQLPSVQFSKVDQAIWVF